jgi:predicted CopG family antitoxin
MTRYVTISVPNDVKETLGKAKGRAEWGEFLLGLYSEARRLRGESAFEELAGSLTERELDLVVASSREFREKFAFR